MVRGLTVTAALLLLAAMGLGQERSDSESFYAAIRNNDTPALRGLTTHADLEVKDPRGATPLMHAAVVGTAEHVKLLLDAGAAVNATSESGATALMAAAGDPVKSAMLIEAGADVNARSQSGGTALMAAASRDSNADLVRALLARGADARAVSSDGDTALLMAAKAADVETMKLLIARGADVNLAHKVLGLTPLGNAVSANNLDAVRLLLASGADVRRPGMNDSVRVRHGRLALQNIWPLLLAAPYGSPEMVETLLKAGADVNARDERGMSALMLAVASETQDVKVVDRLIAAGSDVNVASGAGETALDWANKFGSGAVLARLKRAGAKGLASPVAVAPPPSGREPRDLGAALGTSLALLQRSSAEYSKASGCVGCHHQPMAALAIRSARPAGATIDEAAAREQVRVISAPAAVSQVRALQGIGISDIDIALTSGLRHSDYRADAITDSLAARVASSQLADGKWGRGPALSRAPMQESHISRTVDAIRTLQVYAFPGRKVEFEQRIAKARQWLQTARPRTTDDHAMLLLGLTWTHADARETRRIANTLISQQRTDGGWAGNPRLPSDAFATGEALYALRESGFATPGDSVHERAVRYLLHTQYPDGSWHVRSRAVKLQPYFQSGFPFDHDQWISAAGTAWASTALAATIAHEGKRGHTGLGRAAP